jgi:hypothetical protein
MSDTRMTDLPMTDLSMTDDAFLAGVVDCTLAPRHFNHLGHVRLAWLHLRRHPLDEAVALTCERIARYASHLGAPDKFHYTVTATLVRLLHPHRALAWDAFLAANAALLADARACVGRHFSAELLATAPARTGWVAPDRAPLPDALLPDALLSDALRSDAQLPDAQLPDGPPPAPAR